MPRRTARRRFRLNFVRLALVVIAGVANADEGFRIEATAHPDYPAVAGKVAVLPPVAPEALDRTWLERQVAGEIDRHAAARLVSLRETGAVLARLELDPELPETRPRLAAELGVESFLEIRVSEVERWLANAPERSEGTSLKKQTDRARARVTLRVVAASNGRMLFEGTTFGTGRGKNEKPLVAEMLRRLFDRAFPARGVRSR